MRKKKHFKGKCLLSDNIYDYYNVSQGKITIPNMDDGEENQLTDVSAGNGLRKQKKNQKKKTKLPSRPNFIFPHVY